METVRLPHSAGFFLLGLARGREHGRAQALCRQAWIKREVAQGELALPVPFPKGTRQMSLLFHWGGVKEGPE